MTSTRKCRHFVRTLNHFYLENRCFWENDSDWDGFRWLSCDDRDNSIIAFRRISRKGQELIAVCNFCPVLRESYRLPLPKAGWYQTCPQHRRRTVRRHTISSPRPFTQKRTSSRRANTPTAACSVSRR